MSRKKIMQLRLDYKHGIVSKITAIELLIKWGFSEDEAFSTVEIWRYT